MSQESLGLEHASRFIECLQRYLHITHPPIRSFDLHKVQTRNLVEYESNSS